MGFLHPHAMSPANVCCELTRMHIDSSLDNIGFLGNVSIGKAEILIASKCLSIIAGRYRDRLAVNKSKLEQKKMGGAKCSESFIISHPNQIPILENVSHTHVKPFIEGRKCFQSILVGEVILYLADELPQSRVIVR